MCIYLFSYKYIIELYIIIKHICNKHTNIEYKIVDIKITKGKECYYY